MKRFACIVYIALSGLLIFNSCIREDISGNTPEDNFEALWKIIDEQYCFLDYKNQEYGLDWNEVHERYARRITSDMTWENLFEVLSDMVNELRDGHVNLSSSLATSQYREWFDSYPRNFSDSIQSIYLGKDYTNSSGLTYSILENNIGYIYCSSFSNGIGDGNLDQTLNKLAICDGLIIDVRNNGGGNLTTAQKLAARFTNEKMLVGYMCHKTGPGHSDLSEPKPVYIEPSDGIRWQKKVVVLTNRRSYSATNDFVNSMNQFPNVTIVGDKTGGGSGLPFSSEIPNGWSIRFSASPMFDPEMNQLEFGIDPDVKVDMTSEDVQRGKDTIIETACKILKNSFLALLLLPILLFFLILNYHHYLLNFLLTAELLYFLRMMIFQHELHMNQLQLLFFLYLHLCVYKIFHLQYLCMHFLNYLEPETILHYFYFFQLPVFLLYFQSYQLL